MRALKSKNAHQPCEYPIKKKSYEMVKKKMMEGEEGVQGTQIKEN